MSGPGVTVTSSIAGRISVAFHQNAIPVIQEIALTNDLDRDLADLSVRLLSEPPFATPQLIRIERIARGTSHTICVPDLQLDPSFLRRLTEGVRAAFTIELDL